MKERNILTLIIITLLITPGGLLLFSTDTNADSLTEFGNLGTETERVVTLSGDDGSPLLDAATYFTLPLHKGRVKSATMKIAALEHNGNYPTNPKLDFGLDGDHDWSFSGNGYGSMGHQTEFIDSSTATGICFAGAGFNSSTLIRLPKNAVVSSATIDVSGCSPSIPNGDFETGVFNPWQISGPHSASISTDTPDGSSYSGYIYISSGSASNPSWPSSAPPGYPDNPTNPNYQNVYQTVPGAATHLHFWMKCSGSSWHDGGFVYLEEGTNLVKLFHTGSGSGSANYYPWAEHNIEIPAEFIGKSIKIIFCGHNRNGFGDHTCNIWFDDIYFSDTSGQPVVDYPSDITLDVGADGGTNEWEYTGELSTTVTTDDFRGALNQLLTSMQTTYTDPFGNEFVDITLKIGTSSSGLVLLSSIKIKYSYTAKVDLSPHSGNLANELNDIIPEAIEVAQTEKYFTTYICILSDTPCKVKLSELNVIYNGAPTCSDIPNTYELPEDTYNEYLINLTHYFLDDYQVSEFLQYEVISYSHPEFVDIDIYDRYFLGVNAEREPNTNWHGTIEIVVSARDSEGIKTISNNFTITIKDIDDDPEVGLTIPNLNLTLNGTNRELDLDKEIISEDTTGFYFTDIDSETLYYHAIVAPSETQNLSVTIDPENYLVITSIGNYSPYIPVRIFCDDDEAITELGNFYGFDIYQEITVSVTSPGGKIPPKWYEIPDIDIPEDTIIEDWIDLKDYVIDMDDQFENITFSIVSVSNSAFMTINIDPDAGLDILPNADFDGISEVTLRVEDDEHNFALISFTINMIPENDIPLIDILKLNDREVVSGKVTLEGSAYDVENTLECIELKFGEESGEWIKADGLTYWKYSWDTMEYAPLSPKLVKIYARADDGLNYSELVSIELIVNNQIIDVDGDGIPNHDDLFPNDPSDWTDTDNDGYGNNKDAFPNNASEWLDTDGDGHGDNCDVFPYDPTQHEDQDKDGYGDNPNGNNGDQDPNDPNITTARSNDVDVSEQDTISYLWALVVVLIIIIVLIGVLHFIIQRKGSENSKNK